MRVRYKPTGELGEIPDDKFDPTLFELDSPEVQARQQLTQQPVPQPTPLQQIGAGVADIGKTIFPAVERFGKGIGTSIGLKANEQQEDEMTNTDFQSIEQLQQKAVDLMRQGKMEESKKLLDMTKQNIDRVQKRKEEVTKEVKKTEEDIIKGAAGTAALALPGGSNPLTRIASGTAQGATQGYATSAEGQELPSILGGGVVGGGLSVGGEILSAGAKKFLRPAGEAIETTGEKVRDSTRKIRVRADVGGAQREQQVAKTLNDLDITGTAQQQYEKLQPKMIQLEDEIYDFLGKNNKEIDVSTVKDDFIKNAKAATRTSKIDDKKVKQMVNEYLQDIEGTTNTPLGNKTDSISLFKLKQEFNKDYSKIKDKIDKGIALTPEEEIKSQARKTVDDIISNLHPEVKQKTLQQSDLFDASLSLSRSRDNPPTFRAAGFSIPSVVTQQGADKSGRLLQTMGKTISAGADVLPDIAVNPTLQKVATGMAVDQLNRPIETTPQVSEVDNRQVQQVQAPVGSVQQPQDNAINSIQDQTSSPFQYTTEELAAGYQEALMTGNKQAASEIKAMYKMQREVENKKTSKLTQAEAKTKALTSSGLRGIEEMRKMISEDPNLLAKGLLPGKALSRKYESAAYRTAESMLRLKTGAAVTKKEAEDYARNYLPWLGDDTETIQYKLNQLELDYKDLQGIENAETNTLPSIGGTP